MYIQIQRKNKFLISGFLGLTLLLFSIGCKQNKKKSSTPVTNKETPTASPTPGTTDTTNVDNINATGLASLITIDVDGQTPDKTEFEVEKNAIVRLKLKIGGFNASSNIAVGLAKMPNGTVLSDAQTAAPVITWTAAVEGRQEFLVLVRDLDACKKAGGSDCDFTSKASAPTTANPDYDATKLFVVTVKPAGSILNNNNSLNNNNNNNNNPNNPTTPNPDQQDDGGFFSNMFSSIGNGFSRFGSWLWDLGSGFVSFISGLFG